MENVKERADELFAILENQAGIPSTMPDDKFYTYSFNLMAIRETRVIESNRYQNSLLSESTVYECLYMTYHGEPE